MLNLHFFCSLVSETFYRIGWFYRIVEHIIQIILWCGRGLISTQSWRSPQAYDRDVGHKSITHCISSLRSTARMDSVVERELICPIRRWRVKGQRMVKDFIYSRLCNVSKFEMFCLWSCYRCDKNGKAINKLTKKTGKKDNINDDNDNKDGLGAEVVANRGLDF